MKTACVHLGLAGLLAACGQHTGAVNPATLPASPTRTWIDSSISGPTADNRPTVDGQIIVVGQQTASGWQYCSLYVGVLNDTSYLNGVVSSAQAELNRAQAERIRRQEAELDAITREIRVELARLQERLAAATKAEALLQKQINILVRFTSDRRVDESYIAALRSVATLLGIPVSELFSQKVLPLSADNFASGGSIKIVRNERGEAVFKDTSRDGVPAFRGGSIADYLQWLGSNRLLVKSDRGLEPLKSMMTSLKATAKSRYDEALAKKSELRAQTDASIAKLLSALEILRQEIGDAN
jgi:hypothetical protein